MCVIETLSGVCPIINTEWRKGILEKMLVDVYSLDALVWVILSVVVWSMVVVSDLLRFTGASQCQAA